MMEYNLPVHVFAGCVTLNSLLKENRDQIQLSDISSWDKETDTEDIYKVGQLESP
jgi:hypothetical protein